MWHPVACGRRAAARAGAQACEMLAVRVGGGVWVREGLSAAHLVRTRCTANAEANTGANKETNTEANTEADTGVGWRQRTQRLVQTLDHGHGVTHMTLRDSWYRPVTAMNACGVVCGRTPRHVRGGNAVCQGRLCT